MNNCFGIKAKGGGNKSYETQEAAYADFKDLWNRAYGGFPDTKKATKYVKGPRYVGPPACSWLKSVSRAYNSGL